uniref:Ubiquitin carboxyl-terminal hydrolase MINDY n=1 Tax=Phallusia mammillata TaxID=59560 RepID=A0A6F9DK77_9ASCI|nr:protein FAM188B-like [Phallusia mammillata]
MIMETLNNKNIEDLASSVVREFLSRKKCTGTLQLMDKELPRTDGSVNNRLKLAQSFKIESWMKSNKTKEDPLRTMLEIIIWNILMKQSDSNKSGVTNNVFQLQHKSLDNSLNKQSAVKTQTPVETVTLNEVTSVDITDFESSEADMDDLVAKPRKMQMDQQFAFSSLSSRNILDGDLSSQRIKQPYPVSSSASKKKATSVFEMLSASPEKAITAKQQEIPEPASTFPWDMPKSKHTTKYKEKKKLSTEQNIQSLNVLDLSLCDNEPLNDTIYSWKDVELVQEMRILVLGSVKGSYPKEWLNQNFTFCECTDGRPNTLRFGIVQQKGGPCGVLAAVQATVVKHLLFANNGIKPEVSDLNVTSIERNKSLVEAITEIIWRASDNSTAYLAVAKMGCDFIASAGYQPDNFSENITLLQFNTCENLQRGVQENIKCYLQGKGACLLLLYSVILSRGVQRVRSDMDEVNGKLMGAHNYCTQEMVNLLLTGRATSNAFDHGIKLEENTFLKGLHARSDIGFLSLFEHYGSCQIGDYYKTPKYPIWVVCSESHFTVLFSLDRSIVANSKDSGPFDLIYYDGLANQDEFIQLTVNPSFPVSNNCSSGDLVPPLEHCIRTKWPKATIDWNDTDPIL